MRRLDWALLFFALLGAIQSCGLRPCEDAPDLVIGTYLLDADDLKLNGESIPDATDAELAFTSTELIVRFTHADRRFEVRYAPVDQCTFWYDTLRAYWLESDTALDSADTGFDVFEWSCLVYGDYRPGDSGVGRPTLCDTGRQEDCYEVPDEGRCCASRPPAFP